MREGGEGGARGARGAPEAMKKKPLLSYLRTSDNSREIF